MRRWKPLRQILFVFLLDAEFWILLFPHIGRVTSRGDSVSQDAESSVESFEAANRIWLPDVAQTKCDEARDDRPYSHIERDEHESNHLPDVFIHHRRAGVFASEQLLRPR